MKKYCRLLSEISFLLFLVLVSGAVSPHTSLAQDYTDVAVDNYSNVVLDPNIVDPDSAYYADPLYDDPGYVDPSYVDPDLGYAPIEPVYVNPNVVKQLNQPVQNPPVYVAQDEQPKNGSNNGNFSDTLTLEQKEAFKNLPPFIKDMIKRNIARGEMPSPEELESLPEPVRREILEEVAKILKEKNGEKTEKKDAPKGVESFLSEYWVQLLALVVSLIGVFFAVTGFTFANQKKKKSVANLINQIDDTFASFKWKSKRCEAELYRLEDLVEDQLKNGKIDESSYDLLVRRIKKYLKEVQEVDDPLAKKNSHHSKKIEALAEEIEDNE